MKKYFEKISDRGELVTASQKALIIPQSLNCFSDKNFNCVKNCFKRSSFYSEFKIYLADHPVPQ